MGAGVAKSKEQAYLQSASPNEKKNVTNRKEDTNPPPRGSVLDKDEDDEAPEFLTCPLSFEVMRDPVFTADGHTFERHVIEEWLRDHDTNPMTGKSMPSKTLVPNFAIREACAAYRARNPSNAESIRRYEAAVKKVAESKPSNVEDQGMSARGASTSASSSNDPSSSHSLQHQQRQSQLQPQQQSQSQSQSQSHPYPQPHHQQQHQQQHTSWHVQDQQATPQRNQLRSFSSPPTSTSPSASSSRIKMCSLCNQPATTKKSLGGNNWILVCDSCSVMVESQKSPSSARFRSVSAAEAAQDALSTSIGGTQASSSPSTLSSSSPSRALAASSARNSNIQRHTSSLLNTSGSASMSCSHCRQQTSVSRVPDIDGTQLWLCSKCADTQRQFNSAATAAAAAPTTTSSPSSMSTRHSSSFPRSGSIERRHTVSTGIGGVQQQQNRANFLRSALGAGVTHQQAQSTQSTQSNGGRAWNRDEAMALLEQHEWNQANASSANVMADRLNARYGPSGASSGPSPPGRRRVSPSGAGGARSGDVRGRNGHPLDCPCGLCNRNWAVET